MKRRERLLLIGHALTLLAVTLLTTVVSIAAEPTPLRSFSEDASSATRIVEAGQLIGTSDSESIVRKIRASGELTLSVWLTPANLKQQGPARIVTISSDTSNRNLTLGQDKDRFDVRLRSTQTSNNGLPSLNSPKGSVKTKLMHVAFTRGRGGDTRLYLNGKQVSKGKATGTLKNWNDRYRLRFGDEVSGRRPWEGKLHRVDWFDVALGASKVREIYARGRKGRAPKPPTPEQIAAAHFETDIAPLLAKHCLECHDAASAKGTIVLDRREPAMRDTIVPGDPINSPLWLSVRSDEMPHDRAPLLPEQKELLRKWIADGATWSLQWIDPADYQHEIGSTSGFVRRLTAEEYARSVKVAVDVTLDEDATRLLPRDIRADGFTNTAYNLSVDLSHIQAYDRLAKLIVERVPVKSLIKRFGGQGKMTDRDMRGLIENMGRWILRGPLEEHEIALYRGISTTVASSGGDYEAAVKATIASMLQSPRFLYRMERQDESGETPYLDDYELACRLSFLAWGSPPDEALMDLASEGDLSDPQIVRQQMTRMLKDPSAVDRSIDFIFQWLNLGHVESLRPDQDRFSSWNPELAADMQTETREFFRHVIWTQGRPMNELFDADLTFLTPTLAEHYGITPRGEGLQQYDLSEVPERGGLLTQASVLTIGGDDASMVTRGLFVLHELLRGVVNDPPPCVDTTPVPTAAGLSQRKIATQRIENESCGGCHGRFEPLAFGLERYDGIGRYSVDDEHGNQLRQDGEILVPGTADSLQYSTSEELMEMLAGNPRVGESLVWKLCQFAVGRPLSSQDAPVVRDIVKRSKEHGFTYQAILTEIASSPLIHPNLNGPDQ